VDSSLLFRMLYVKQTANLVMTKIHSTRFSLASP